jgi:hypothetical protein
MGKESGRELSSNENDALYWSLRFAQQNPTAVGIDEEELQGVNDLIDAFRSGKFRISERMTLIK